MFSEIQKDYSRPPPKKNYDKSKTAVCWIKKESSFLNVTVKNKTSNEELAKPVVNFMLSGAVGIGWI